MGCLSSKTHQDWLNYLNTEHLMFPQMICNECEGAAGRCECAEFHFRFDKYYHLCGMTIAIIPDFPRKRTNP